MTYHLRELAFFVTIVASNAWGVRPGDSELGLRRVGDLRSVPVPASDELQRLYAPRGLERYTYPGPAETLAELIEDAIRSRASVGRPNDDRLNDLFSGT
jgi:hypothetical protein